MKTINNYDIKADSFFGGVGYLKEVGEYQQEAYDILGIEGDLDDDEWCDICIADNGKKYAVFGDTAAHNYGNFYFKEIEE